MRLPKKSPPRGTPNGTRSGTVLVLFAALVFAVLGIAALTIDIGYAALAQAQMQSAVDTAAMEGVRLRDFYEYRPLSNIYRRPRTSHLVQYVMDDDMHPTAGVPASSEGIPEVPPDDADALRLGAGPILHLVDGFGDANASATILVPDGDALVDEDAWVDDPHLQQNRRNLPSGDMLSGTFHRFASHAENADYERDDFSPALEVSGDTSESWRSLGYLVRMRRTRGTNALDSNPNVASRGPTIPFLFGMGSTIHADDPSSYDPRYDGLTTRAVAIAVGRPAMSAGPQPLNSNGAPLPDRYGRPIRGVGFWRFPAGIGTPAQAVQRRHCAIALAQSFWSQNLALQTHEQTIITVRSDGRIEFQASPSVIEIVGHLMLAPCDVAGASSTCSATTGTSVGLFVGEDVSQAPYSLTQAEIDAALLDLPRTPCYFPIYASVTNGAVGEKRIIAFGYGELEGGDSAGEIGVALGWQGGQDEPECQVVVAPDNASASLTSRELPSLSVAVWDQIFEQSNQFAYPSGNLSYAWQNVRPGTALAPALIR